MAKRKPSYQPGACKRSSCDLLRIASEEEGFRAPCECGVLCCGLNSCWSSGVSLLGWQQVKALLPTSQTLNPYVTLKASHTNGPGDLLDWPRCGSQKCCSAFMGRLTAGTIRACDCLGSMNVFSASQRI